MTADRAVTAVEGVITRAGHAPERILQDYGEDLLVQTSHAGRMDSSRLWFQVKGTDDIARYRLKSGGMSFSVGYDTAARWVRSSDLVALVLWDTTAETGWFALPENQVDGWEDLDSLRQTTTLRFAENDRFDHAAVDRLAWESRINHYRLLILSARDVAREREEAGESQSQLRLAIALDFLIMLELIERQGSDPVRFAVPRHVREGVAESLKSREWDDEPRVLVAAAIIETVLKRVQKIDKELGLPMVLIEEAADLLTRLLRIREVLDTYK